MKHVLAIIALLSGDCGHGVTCPQLPDRDDGFSNELTAEIAQLQIPDATAVVMAANEDVQLRAYFVRVCSGT